MKMWFFRSEFFYNCRLLRKLENFNEIKPAIETWEKLYNEFKILICVLQLLSDALIKLLFLLKFSIFVNRLIKSTHWEENIEANGANVVPFYW